LTKFYGIKHNGNGLFLHTWKIYDGGISYGWARINSYLTSKNTLYITSSKTKADIEKLYFTPTGDIHQFTEEELCEIEFTILKN